MNELTSVKSQFTKSTFSFKGVIYSIFNELSKGENLFTLNEEVEYARLICLFYSSLRNKFQILLLVQVNLT